MVKRHYVPGLDGLRAISILTVIFCHLQQRFHTLQSPAPVPDGVELFFVLSGFLITGLLLREQEGTGTIRLSRFYVARLLRLAPPLVCYFLCLLLAFRLVHDPIPWRGIGEAALLLCYPQPSVPFFAEHLWSLVIEAQFYLIWPPLLFAALRLGGPKLAARTTLVLLAASLLCRVAMGFSTAPMLAHQQAVFLPARMDALFAGSWMSLCAGENRFERLYERWKPFWWTAPLFFFVLSPILRLLVGNAYTFTAGYTAESLSAALGIIWLTRSPHTAVSRILGSTPFVFLGSISYSLYLYQTPLIRQWPLSGSPWEALFASVLAGTASYLLVERPVMHFRSSRRVCSEIFNESSEKRHEPEPLLVIT